MAIGAGAPQLLLYANRARPQWRQAVYLALATGAFDCPRRFFARVGHQAKSARRDLRALASRLPSMTPSQIVAGCFDQAPDGLFAVLKKVGLPPLRQDTYGSLAKWHVERSSHFARCVVLSKMTLIDQGRIDALGTLDQMLVMPAVLGHLSSKGDADHLNALLDVIRKLCSAADDDTLRVSARDLQGVATTRGWAEGWLRRSDRLPEPPFVGDAECLPLTTASEVIDATRRFKNCLGNRYLSAILCGKVTVVEYKPQPALALLAPLTGGHWLFVSTHIAGNARVSDDLARRVQAKVLSFGGHIHGRGPHDVAIASVTDKIFGDYEPFDLGWQAFDF